MKDLIERDAAIHAMECEIEIVGRSNAIIVQNAARMIVQRIKDIPPADVVDRKNLVETIRHFAQYPDGMTQLLKVYEEDGNV